MVLEVHEARHNILTAQCKLFFGWTKLNEQTSAM